MKKSQKNKFWGTVNNFRIAWFPVEYLDAACFLACAVITTSFSRQFCPSALTKEWRKEEMAIFSPRKTARTTIHQRQIKRNVNAWSKCAAVARNALASWCLRMFEHKCAQNMRFAICTAPCDFETNLTLISRGNVASFIKDFVKVAPFLLLLSKYVLNKHSNSWKLE